MAVRQRRQLGRQGWVLGGQWGSQRGEEVAQGAGKVRQVSRLQERREESVYLGSRIEGASWILSPESTSQPQVGRLQETGKASGGVQGMAAGWRVGMQCRASGNQQACRHGGWLLRPLPRRRCKSVSQTVSVPLTPSSRSGKSCQNSTARGGQQGQQFTCGG